jgi:hypothetical protein
MVMGSAWDIVTSTLAVPPINLSIVRQTTVWRPAFPATRRHCKLAASKATPHKETTVIQTTRRQILGVLLASTVLLSAQAQMAGQETPTVPLKVLFVGNSYTSVNDLPSMVVGLAEVAGGRKIEVDRHFVGGCTLEKHAKDQKAIDKIRAAKWDVVVLQEHSLRPVIDRQAMHEYARLLDAEIRKQGAKTVFYLTWARQHVPDMQEGADPGKSPDYA